jgi:hypothetical protein
LVSGAAFLALTPLNSLQIMLPAYLSPPPSLQNGTGEMPLAGSVEWNLLTGFYEAINQFLIPLLK